MDPSIVKIIKNHRVDSLYHTHVSMIHPRGKYAFSRGDLEEFWSVYCNKVKENNNFVVGIAEKGQSFLPVLADVDIKVRENDDTVQGDKIYDDKHLIGVIEVYQSILRKIIEGCTDDNLLCVLLEKPLYRVNKNGISYVKNGFHLHFPNCFLSKVDQEVHLIPRVQDAIRDLELFKDLGFDDSGSVIDKACCKVPWLLYGSRKDGDNMQPYKVTKVYDSELSELDLEDAFKYYKLYDKKEKTINIRGKVEFYLPRILSIIPFGRDECELKHGLISPLKQKIKEKQQSEKKYDKNVVKDLAEAKKILPMVGNFRSEDRNEWMTIGWALYNISEGSQEGLELWCDFSSRCPEEYDESTCIFQWERMIKKDITLGTLKYYASIDNPEEYKKYKAEQTEKHMIEALGGSHNDIAKILYSQYADEFVCASISSKLWFQFTNHKWEQIEEGVFLRKKISDEIVDRFTKVGQELFGTVAKCSDKGEEAMHQARIKQVQKMVGNLKAAPFKSNVMKESCEVFYDKRFKEKLDTNPYLIAFKNGVYDLKLNTFRPGRPEDFISKCMPIDYIEYTEDDEKVHDVYNFLEKVFPDKSLRRYFLDASSDVFVGGNHQKTVYFWTGEGDNAKSVTQNFFEQMLGPLAIKFNTTVVTGKKPSSGSAYADLARAGGGVRWAVLEEPDGDEMINVGVLKHLSGNDSFYARDLFERGKDGREIKPMFKLIFVCNKLPKLKYSDKATWNRIRVIPFESTFCRPSDPAPTSYEEQLKQKRFPMDKEFGKKIPGLVKAFAWVLLKHRQNITTRDEPEKVRMATAVYRKQNDIYRQFIEECITEDSGKSISLTELYAQFKDWFRESLPHHNLPIKNEVEDYFTRVWDVPSRGKKWKGYRFRTLEDKIDDGDAVILDEDDLVDYEEEGKNLPPL